MARITTATLLAAMLAGCAAQGGGQAIRHSEPTFMRLTEERVFAQALRQRYLELATNAYDRSDFVRSDFYSLRAIMAVEGKLVDPAGSGAGKGDPALDAARLRLNHSLSAGARTGAPDLAARAQAGYDCWWLESDKGGDPAIADACAFNTTNVLAELDSLGTGLSDARRAEPRQYVITGDTPSQTIEAGGAMIEVVRQQLPAAPRSYPEPAYYDEPSYAAPPPVAPLAALPKQPIQFRSALSDTMQGIEPMQSHSSRTFVIEPPAPLPDTVIPTVPFLDPAAPMDLIPDYDAVAPFVPSQGGQYTVTDIDRYAAVEPYTQSDLFMNAPIPSFGSPVYSDASTAPTIATPVSVPVMMEQPGGVLSTLLDARSDSAATSSVYFGFDSAEITPEGEDVLRDTLEQLTLQDRGSVSLMGFTDSAGDSRYNQLLAMRRANAVRSFIQKGAGRSVRFEIMPVGEAEAVRNGGDGVTEALNRRVEIILR